MKIVIKNIPNSITILRIVLSLLLFLLKPFSPIFLIVYSACGFTDMIDGYIARKTNSESSFGTILDSISDIVFMFVVVIVLIPVIYIPMRILIWTLVIALIRIASMVTAYFKYHAFAILHTYTNKAAGFLLFCFPFSYTFIEINLLECIICAAASISAVEELIIHISSKELSRNIKGIFVNKI